MKPRLQLAALVATDLVLIWVVSSVLRGKGLVAFAAGSAVLLWTLARVGRGAARPFLLLSFVLVLAGSGVLATEAALRLRPSLLRGRAANAVYGGYHDESDGVYDHDDHLGCVMRPGFRRRMYWNGRWWGHETNEDGYRGRRVDRAQAVFLGDSMIYGHALEAGESVPARFEAAGGGPAANLGQQGTCLLQGLMLLQSRGARLRPKVVFACAHPNDVADASYWYEPQELRRFLVEDEYLPSARREFRRPEAPFAFWLRHVSLPLYTGRALRALTAREAEAAATPSAGGDGAVPAAGVLDAPFAPEREGELAALGWQVQKQALTRLKSASEAIGARLVVFDLGYPTAASQAIEEAARAAGAEYDPVGRRVLARARAGEDMYLRDDGHWTPAASDIIGRTLAAR